MRARLAIAALVSCTLARANPADTHGLGSRSTALGGAVSAGVRDFSANYYNPSALALIRSTELSVGYAYVSHQLEMNGHDSQVDPVRGLVGGIVAPGNIATIPFAFGIAAHLSDERLSRARSTRQEVPRWVLYDNRPQLLYLSANVALRPVPWLAVGGGIAYLAATRGSFQVTGTAVLPNGDRTEYDSKLRHEVDADLTAVRYPQAGITVRPTDELDLALVYRGEARIELSIDAELEGDVDATLLSVPAHYELVSRTTNAFIPQQAVLGASYRPSEALELGLDVTWVDWSAYPTPVSRSRSVLDVDAPDIIELPPDPKPTRLEDPAFSDRLVPRVGVEYRLSPNRQLRVPLRAGYVYERTPVPPQTGVTNFVDTDRHSFSLGAGVVLLDPGELIPGELRFDTHAVWSLLPTRVTLKDNAADYVGDYRARGSIVNVGASVSVGFE